MVIYIIILDDVYYSPLKSGLGVKYIMDVLIEYKSNICPKSLGLSWLKILRVHTILNDKISDVTNGIFKSSGYRSVLCLPKLHLFGKIK